jgi:calcium channel MID1
MDYWTALTSTLPTMYVSTDVRNQAPGPDNSKLGEPDIEPFFGGLAQSSTPSAQDDGAWIAIYPPVDARNASGTWNLIISASTEIKPITYVPTQGLTFADSDRTNALLATYNSSQGTSGNLTLALLPTEGPGSLQNAFYFGSSPCAIAPAFNSYNSTRNADRPSFVRSDTTRGSVLGNGTHVQWAVSDLDPSTNYTAWLFDVGSLAPESTLQTTTLWAPIKFVTKKSQNCRLVYDVDFCPEVAYSIPVGPDISTDDALSIINQTFAPNMANFSATLSTFPCGSKDFGQYSALKGCDDCTRAYRNWLCAVTMPRCTDPLSVVDNSTSAAYPDPFDLDGVPTETNTDLLPYVVNRQNNSRQGYIDARNGLDAGSYAELLPCIYTCYAVASSCPQPLFQWYCPLWDISAQSQYGSFADAGAQGLGGGQNGGAGQNGQRWGGLTEYISQDNFGNVYCNSMYVEKQLLLTNGATKDLGHDTLVLASTIALTILILS